MSTGRSPSHSVKVFDASREEDKGKYVGVGWSQRDGSIAIKLDAGMVLTSVGARIVIFPRKDRDGGSRRDEERPGQQYG